MTLEAAPSQADIGNALLEEKRNDHVDKGVLVITGLAGTRFATAQETPVRFRKRLLLQRLQSRDKVLEFGRFVDNLQNGTKK